jgi:hypothetical protein
MGAKKTLISILIILIYYSTGVLFSQNSKLNRAKQNTSAVESETTNAVSEKKSVDSSKLFKPKDDWLKNYVSTWKNISNVMPAKSTAPVQIDLLAKGQPDECFVGVGDPGNTYNPQWGNLPINCATGSPKVNQAYIWGMAKKGNDIWFGTIANTHMLVLGGILDNLGLTNPVLTSSWVAEYGQSQFPFPPLFPDAFKDWRPPRMFVYNTLNNALTEKTPIANPIANAILQTTAGIRCVATLGDIVLMGGPSLAAMMPGTGAGISLFAFNAQNGNLIGATTLPAYNDIRSSLVLYGELYLGVGNSLGGGNVLRWTGDLNNPFQFEVVGILDGDAANLAFFENRIFVSTWGLQIFAAGGLTGLWMSPEIAPNGKLESGHAGAWDKKWEISEYEPDIMTAMATFGGALAAYDGYLYWGTLHIPLMSFAAHAGMYGMPQDTEDIIGAFFASNRAISIFRGKNFAPGKQVDLLYGMPTLPKYTPDDPQNPTAGGQWELAPNNMGSMPLYGPSGFGNMFNTYTWSMAVHQNELYVGTFDWSYLFPDFIVHLLDLLGIANFDLTTIEDLLDLMAFSYGADLFRFVSNDLPAFPQDINGVTNYLNYGIRCLISDGDLFLGTANPMNLMTDLTDTKPEGGWELLRLSGTPIDPQDILTMLKLFWQGIYTNMMACCDPSPSLSNWLMAKAAPDECFVAPGDPANNYDPQYGNIPIDCNGNGVPKVNQAYVWGLTQSGDNIWFGTWANGLQQVLGMMSTVLGMDFPPVQTNSWVAEFGASNFSPPLPQGFGDWRPPRMFAFNHETWTLTEKTPTDPQAALLLQSTSGISSAGALGDVVIFGGPGINAGINLFAFNAQTGDYIGATSIPGYIDIKQWLVVNGVLYVGVGTTTGGKVLKWTGNAANPFNFEEVGNLTENAAFLAYHEDRIFVSTWGGEGIGLPNVSGIWMSPQINGGSLSVADVGNWQKVWSITDYDPDLVAAHTTLGGALASFDGYLIWGTMNVPATGVIGHFMTYGIPGISDYLDITAAVIGTYRNTSIFRGKDFGTAGETKDVLYGMPLLPTYNGASWQIVPNGMGNPLFGLSGFGNIYNSFTWSMEVYNNQLFVGTMDLSYLGLDIIQTIIQLALDYLKIQTPMAPDLVQQVMGFFNSFDCFFGADLWRFTSSSLPAVAEDATGVGNNTNYGVPSMVTIGDNNPLNLKRSTGCPNTGLILGMANPMNLLADPNSALQNKGGWELKLLAVDADKDRIPDFIDGGRDRDGDGTINCLDYDPAGYFYKQGTGKIIPDGKIAVTGPGPVVIVHDGSDGYYEWYITTPGVYTLQVTLPPGFSWSPTCQHKTGPFDPTNQGQNPVVLGHGENGNTGYLVNNECTDFYLEFDLEVGDPIIINNNFPLKYTGPIGITLSSFTSTMVNGQINIEWSTESEPNNAGFNIFRSHNENDEYLKINSDLIPAQGDATNGASYNYFDSVDEPGTYYYKLETIGLDGEACFHGPTTVTATLVDIRKNVIPENYELSQNYPNPFNPETTIEFGLPKPGFVEISIYDINGKLVRKLISQRKSAGRHSIVWNGKDNSGSTISSGVYYYTFKAGKFNQTRKMILMK